LHGLMACRQLAWLAGSTCVDQCTWEDEHVQNEVLTLIFARLWADQKHSCLIEPFSGTNQLSDLICYIKSPTSFFLVSFPCKIIDFFCLILSMWVHLWLAETSQQPFSHTTWLVVTSYCNHCMHVCTVIIVL
jgi:hypothetical protein